MTIIYPQNRKEVSDRINTDVQNELPELTPSLRDSIINALIIGFAGRFFDIYEQQQQAQAELFPDTATELTFARRWGLFKGIDIRPASAALGLITTNGLSGTIIPEGTLFQTTSNLDYAAITQDYVIVDVSLEADTLKQAAGIATFTTKVDHNFAANMPINIFGADQAEYNGSFEIKKATARTFTYEIPGNPASPATGTPTAGTGLASIDVQSVGTGLVQNRTSGDVVTLNNPIAGVELNSHVQFEGITGGRDEETEEEYRARYLDAYANPISNSNDTDIERVLKAIPGITKVWTFDATPQPGKFETYFIRGNDKPSIFPDGAEVEEARQALLKIKPAPMRNEDVIVRAPTPVKVIFTFTALVPNSQALQNAITASLTQLFIDETELAEDLQEDAYRAAIFQTINPETGQFVQSFALSQPSGDIAVGAGELAELSTITFNVT